MPACIFSAEWLIGIGILFHVVNVVLFYKKVASSIDWMKAPPPSSTQLDRHEKKRLVGKFQMMRGKNHCWTLSIQSRMLNATNKIYFHN